MTLKTVPSYRRIWEISLPIILSLLAQNIVNVTDTAFLGRVGEVELGACAHTQVCFTFRCLCLDLDLVSEARF